MEFFDDCDHDDDEDDDDDDVKSSLSFIHPIWSNLIHKPGKAW